MAAPDPAGGATFGQENSWRQPVMGSIIHNARIARIIWFEASWIHDPSGAYWPRVTNATAATTTRARIRTAMRIWSRYRTQTLAESIR